MEINILGVIYNHFNIENPLDFEFLSDLSVIENHYTKILTTKSLKSRFEDWIHKLCDYRIDEQTQGKQNEETISK